MGPVATVGDDFELPTSVSLPPRAFSSEDVEAYARLSNDFNPIHLDPEFAAKSIFGKPIVHGLLVVAPIWEMLERHVGHRRIAVAEARIRFVAPTLVGEKVSTSGHLTGTAGKSARYELTVQGEDGGNRVIIQLVLPLHG